MNGTTEVKVHTDFDYENPFYGNNRDMTYSELCDLYEKVTGRSATA